MGHDAAESGPQVPGEAGQGAGPEGARAPLTGEPRVDAALARLDELPDLPVTEHRAVFEHVHKSLTDVLGELDDGLPPDAGEDDGAPGESAGHGPGGPG